MRTSFDLGIGRSRYLEFTVYREDKSDKQHDTDSTNFYLSACDPSRRGECSIWETAIDRRVWTQESRLSETARHQRYKARATPMVQDN